MQATVEKLALSINIGIENLYNSFNRNISLKDNILCVVKDFEVVVNASGIPSTQSSFLLDINNKIGGLVIMKATNLTNSNSYPTSGVFPTWTQSNNAIIISHITGLQPGDKYLLRIVAFGD